MTIRLSGFCLTSPTLSLRSWLAAIDLSALVFRRLAAIFLCYHIVGMARTHPHADATYEVITLPGGTFGVKVSIPDTYPATVSTFATKADAKAWIATHKSRVETQATGWFRAPRTRTSASAGG